MLILFHLKMSVSKYSSCLPDGRWLGVCYYWDLHTPACLSTVERFSFIGPTGWISKCPVPGYTNCVHISWRHIMCPDNPELQYRAEFPVHFPLSVLINFFKTDEGEFCPLYNYIIYCFSTKFSQWEGSYSFP